MMDKRPSLENIREALVRQGLPCQYIERLVSELNDHFADTLEERESSMNTAGKLTIAPTHVEQKLGNPEQLAAFAADQHHARTFWGRHRWITFVIAPLPLYAACFVAVAVALGQVVSGAMLAVQRFFPGLHSLHEHPYLQGIMCALCVFLFQVVPALATAWILCRVAGRNALSWRWPMTGCALVALVTALFTAAYRLETSPGNGMFAVGFELGDFPAWYFLAFLPKFAVAIVIGALLVLRARPLRSQESDSWKIRARSASE